eukprot:363925-Chlamydomonas_euryale.AAC.19
MCVKDVAHHSISFLGHLVPEQVAEPGHARVGRQSRERGVGGKQLREKGWRANIRERRGAANSRERRGGGKGEDEMGRGQDSERMGRGKECDGERM